jgi:hypothetical protein
MARHYGVHSVDPQPHSIAQVVALLRDDAPIACPTDASNAFGCQMGNPTGVEPTANHAAWTSGTSSRSSVRTSPSSVSWST